MSARELIKNSVLKGFEKGTLSFQEIIIVLLVAVGIGIYIFFIYRLLSKSAFYSLDYNITMASIVVVTAAIMVAMQSNLIVSLGMVGALSIVRFRTAIKNPLDLLYMFWAIAVGIICGVQLFMLAAIVSIVVTLMMLGLREIPGIKAAQIISIKGSNELDYFSIQEIIKKCRYSKKRAVMYRGGEAVNTFLR